MVWLWKILEVAHALFSCVVIACKHAHHDYKNYIRLVYTLESVSNIYRWLFGELHNEAYWSPCHKPMISLDLEKKTSTKGHLVFTHIHTEMDIREPGQPKWCFVCLIIGHSKKNFPHHVDSSQQHWMYVILFVFVKFCCINSNLYLFCSIVGNFKIFCMSLVTCVFF